MLVRATAVGYAGKNGHALRQPGDVFEVEDGAKATWFEPVEEPKGSKPKGKPGGDNLV